MNLTELCEHMKEVAGGCGSIIRGAGEQEIGAAEKSSFRDLVTKYDVAVQDFAISKLAQFYPEAAFISEESDNPVPDPEAIIFVIDPIDGTANFVHHMHHSCTSIACVQNGKTIAAVIYDPYEDEMFWAIRGEGAFLNGERLTVPDRTLSESLVLIGTSPYYMEIADETMQIISGVFGRCQDIRRSGSAALDLCYVAAGRAGLFFETVLSVWDYAAGSLIVEEAGGWCVTYSREPVVVDRPYKSSIIAGSAEMISESGIAS